MKRIFKFFIIMIILNFVAGISFLGWFTSSVFAPSFEGTDITISDLFQKNLDPAIYQKLEHNLNQQSSKMGKKAAETVIKGLKVIFPSKAYDFSIMPKADYPYPSSDEVMKLNNENVQKGIDEGLNNLADMQSDNQAIKDATLSQ